MSDQSVNPIGRQANEQTVRFSGKEKVSKPVEKSTPPAESSQFTNSLSQTRVQFQVDEKTNDVIILIRDQASDQVVRTIPAEAINDLPPGQVLNVLS